MSEFHLTAESPQTEVILLKTFVNRACGFFSSTACFADFYGHHDTKTVTIKKNCDLNGNNCKVEITYIHLGIYLSQYCAAPIPAQNICF